MNATTRITLLSDARCCANNRKIVMQRRYTISSSRARTAAAVREATPSLARMCATCVFTVCKLITSCSAIAALLAPRAIKRSTSSSRGLSVSPVAVIRKPAVCTIFGAGSGADVVDVNVRAASSLSHDSTSRLCAASIAAACCAKAGHAPDLLRDAQRGA